MVCVQKGFTKSHIAWFTGASQTKKDLRQGAALQHENEAGKSVTEETSLGDDASTRSPALTCRVEPGALAAYSQDAS